MGANENTVMTSATPALKAPPDVDRIHVAAAEIDYYRGESRAGRDPRPVGGEFDINLLLPIPAESQGAKPTDEMQKVVDQAQRELMQNVARASRSTMRRIGASFTGHLAMNVLLFLVGIGSFAVAVYKGLENPDQADAVVSAAFGGLTAASFITYFITRPMDSVATSGPEAAWLLGMVNTYWTKLIYLNDPVKFPTEIEKAQKAFEASMKAYVEAVAAHRKAVSNQVAEPSTDGGGKAAEQAVKSQGVPGGTGESQSAAGNRAATDRLPGGLGPGDVEKRTTEAEDGQV